MTALALVSHRLPPPSTSKPWRELHLRLACAAAAHPDFDGDELLDVALADDLPDHMAATVRPAVRAVQVGLVEERLLIRSRSSRPDAASSGNR
jgi:hypothetical protein